MAEQKRPISGGLANGQPIAIAPGGTVVHTVPAVSEARGGPVMDRVNIFVNNITAGALVATVTTGPVGGTGTAIEVTIAADSTALVLLDHTLLATDTAVLAVTIGHAGAAGALMAFGNFVRN